jgi:hypothetical protein
MSARRVKRARDVTDVYGFVAWIASSVAAGNERARTNNAFCVTHGVAAAVWFVWAYVPDKWLALLDITYYPSKYWAAALPLYVLSVR